MPAGIKILELVVYALCNLRCKLTDCLLLLYWVYGEERPIEKVQYEENVFGKKLNNEVVDPKKKRKAPFPNN